MAINFVVEVYTRDFGSIRPEFSHMKPEIGDVLRVMSIATARETSVEKPTGMILVRDAPDAIIPKLRRVIDIREGGGRTEDVEYPTADADAILASPELQIDMDFLEQPVVVATTATTKTLRGLRRGYRRFRSYRLPIERLPQAKRNELRDPPQGKGWTDVTWDQFRNNIEHKDTGEVPPGV